MDAQHEDPRDMEHLPVMWRHVRPNAPGQWLYLDCGWQLLSYDEAAEYPLGAYWGPLPQVEEHA